MVTTSRTRSSVAIRTSSLWVLRWGKLLHRRLGTVDRFWLGLNKISNNNWLTRSKIHKSFNNLCKSTSNTNTSPKLATCITQEWTTAERTNTWTTKRRSRTRSSNGNSSSNGSNKCSNCRCDRMPSSTTDSINSISTKFNNSMQASPWILHLLAMSLFPDRTSRNSRCSHKITRSSKLRIHNISRLNRRWMDLRRRMMEKTVSHANLRRMTVTLLRTIRTRHSNKPIRRRYWSVPRAI